MKRKFYQIVVLFLILVPTHSCSGRYIDSRDILTDFPETKQLNFEYVNSFDTRLPYIDKCMVDDSVLWVLGETESNFGYCFNIETGKELSVVLHKGKAANEIVDLRNSSIVGDSIQFVAKTNEIKTFSKNDIINNLPMYKRKFTVVPPPSNIGITDRLFKQEDGTVIGTVLPWPFKAQDFAKDYPSSSASGDDLVVVYNDKELNTYGQIDYKKIRRKFRLDVDDVKTVIDVAYRYVNIDDNKGKMAVFASKWQGILYLFDIEHRKMVKEVSYGKMLGTKDILQNDMNLYVVDLKSDNEKIVCIIRGHLSKEDKQNNIIHEMVLVFNWRLEPIKRFDIQTVSNRGISPYFISEDCSSIYVWGEDEEGLSLHKSQLQF